MAHYDALNYILGNNNLITVVENGQERPLGPEGVKGLKITVNGDRNRIRLELPIKFSDSRLVMMGDDNTFSMRRSEAGVRKAFFLVNNGCHIKIGKNCFFNNDVTIMAKEKKGTKIIIGNDCAISAECIIRCSDGHTMYDAETKEPLNMPRDVIIGHHVWLGARCIVLKGSYISQDSIVGAMSLVNKQFEESNVVIAGAPAKVINHDVSWDMNEWQAYERKNDFFYEDDDDE